MPNSSLTFPSPYINFLKWVRQNIIEYLNKEKGYPISLMSIEKKNEINNIKKRCDIVCNDKNGNPLLLIECKAQSVNLNSNAFNQSITYQKIPLLTL